jgi:hypothetical protein
VHEVDHFTNEDYNGMIDNWICIEDEDEVMNAICEDEIEEMESDRKPAADDIVEDDNEPEVQPMEIDGDEADVFSYLEAVENVLKLQKSAHKLGVNEAATVHLSLPQGTSL